MPGYGESPMLAAAPANAGDYADALARMLDRAGVEQTILVGHSLGALVAAAFAAKYPQRVLYLALADVAQGYGQGGSRTAGKSLAGASTADSAGRRGDGPGERQNRCALARAKPMWRRWRRGCAGYAATVISPAAWMLAHDDIHRWLADYRGRLSVWCGEQDAITQPELSAGRWRCVTAPLTSPSLRLDMPAISITKSFLINSFCIGEEVRDE